MKASAAAAANETHEQLQRRIDQAQAETRALSEAKQEASAAADKAQSQGSRRELTRGAFRRAQGQGPATGRSGRRGLRCVRRGLAAADAFSAIDFADWAVENARLAILDAIDARAYADEQAAALV